MNRLHLICNAHLDPVWQWEWEEGAAAAVSTFRTAAEFCEEFDGFIFNHNEALLYQWVEEYEPSLFARIQRLVQAGKWHIIGGWYLQPDCNMPSAESFIRQILHGQRYFRDKFGAAPTTAVNFDSFGHTRGLVQILKKFGYDSYLFMRPSPEELPLPDQDFIWVGYDGSRILAHRILEGYNSLLGQAANKVRRWLTEHPGLPLGMLAWGVGDHGGGPSRMDLRQLDELMNESTGWEIRHSTPEAYFQELAAGNPILPEVAAELNPNAVGCYTSQVRIKQKHRLLENELYLTEKMLSAAALPGRLPYPREELGLAFRKLLFSEFHDILPGSSVQPVEEASLRSLDSGLEIASQLKARAFFALSAGQAKAGEGEIPILVYNPHPFKVRGVFECEFMLPDQNWKDEFTLPVVYQNGVRLPSQPEKENSNISLDWRKRVAFAAELESSRMNRFDCRLETLAAKPRPALVEEEGRFIFKTERIQAAVNRHTGWFDYYRVDGYDYLTENAFQALVADDCDDSWAGTQYRFRDLRGRFELMSPEAGTRFSGVHGRLLDAVRVIEDGPVRTVVEAVFSYGDSMICQRYKLPRHGTELELEVRVYWLEKTKMLKLSVPTRWRPARYLGQAAGGIKELPIDGSETLAQKWCAAVTDEGERMLTIINEGCYGSDFQDGEIRLSLLRSPGYTALDMSQFGAMDRPILPEDRFSPRMDQGERLFRFWCNGGKTSERLTVIDREALAHNEKPFALSFFPAGDGEKPAPLIELGDEAIQMTAFKRAEEGEGYIIRLYEPTGQPRATKILLPALGIHQTAVFGAFEIKTFRLDLTARSLVAANMLEEKGE